MVYCGRPSKGCGQCRSRKIKCDQARPVCSQCTRANLTCSGYRDELSLLFRDESQQVVRKAKAAGSSETVSRSMKRRRTASPAGNGAEAEGAGSLVVDAISTEEPEPQQYDCGPLVLRWLSVPLKEQATSFFFSSFAWLGTSILTKGGVFAPKLEDSLGGKALLAGIASVGSATLSNIHNCLALSVSARENYASALRFTNAALADPSQAKADSTFTAVILLALFEVITCKSSKTIDNWTDHVGGATALLHLRGLQRLDDESGLRMFSQLRNQILISCLQRKKRVPPLLAEWSEKAASVRLSHDAHVDRLTNIVTKLCNLRADVASKAMTESTEIISAAYAIESELTAWVVGLPSKWAYTIVNIPRRDFDLPSQADRPYNGRYHIYEDLWICYAWNNYRAARILVNEIILNRLRVMQAGSATISSCSEFRVQCRNYRATMRQLAADVCYSMPYLTGDINTDGIQVGDVSVSKASVGGFLLLWPLFTAASVDGCDSPIGEWAIGRFYRAGRGMGIGQALAMIDILVRDTGLVGWVDRMDRESDMPGTGNVSINRVCDQSAVDDNPWWDWEMARQDIQSTIAV